MNNRKKEILQVLYIPRIFLFLCMLLTMASLISWLFGFSDSAYFLIFLFLTIATLFLCFLKFTKEIKVYRYGKIANSTVTKKNDAISHIKYTVSFTNNDTEFHSDFIVPNVNIMPKYSENNYTLPNVGESLIIYFLEEDPNQCYPSINQFFKEN